MRSRRAIPLAVTLLAYVVAVVQRPGQLVADTKVNLYLDPSRFLGDVLSLWSPTSDLGHVWAGQYAGYAWPLAPWFAVGDWIGLPTWLVHRLWLGTLLALAGWGVVRLLDALLEGRGGAGAARGRGALHAAAAVLFVVNPYVTVYFARQSIALLAYASLPWLLLCLHRGLRDPRGWRWPAAFALVLTSAGGGVNAGLTGWVLVGPLLMVLYELWLGEVGWRRSVVPFVVRLAPVALVANLWWVVPLAASASAAPDFLSFTEQPGTIWGTTSLPESLRLMGFWGSYVGTGFGGHLRPYQGSAPVMLLVLPVVVASLLTPALALSAFVSTRRWRYAPFFLVLVLAGLVVMSAGWPEGTPMRRLVTGVYYHVPPVQFLRTTYKAGALTALGLAGLGGAAFAAVWRSAAVRPVLRWGALAGGAVIVAVGSWPLVTGRAVEGQLQFDVPSSYRALSADLDARGDATRAMVFPGQLFAFYDWGGTVDPVLPAMTRRPVATRWIVPFADRRSSDLQFAVDAQVTQGRLRGMRQLPSLLDLMGVGDVVVAADGDRAYSGEMPAGDAVRALRSLGPATKAYGSTVLARPSAASVDAGTRVPELARIATPTGGMVRVLPRAGATVADGASGAVVGLASFGALDPGRALAYAPDLGAAGVRAAAAAPGGAAFVVADGNRRRAFVAARARGQAGPTLTAAQEVTSDGVVMDPFGAQSDPGAAARETVAVYGGGVRDVTAPASPQVTQFPEDRPYAALDGDPSTAWIADRRLVPVRADWTVDFDGPRDVDAIDLMPYGDARGRVRAVEVGGRRFAVRSGWNHLELGLKGARSLTIHLADVTRPKHGTAGAGGLREVRIPGVTATETLRVPTVVESALRGADLRRSSLTYLLERTTADVPFRQGRYAGERGATELRDARDPEAQLRRSIAPPAARGYAVDAWATVDPRTPDSALDALVGAGAGGGRASGDALHADSSARFEGLGRYRASGAFDGDGGRDWIAQWIPGRPAWIAWTAPRTTAVRTLALAPPGVRVRRPTRVALRADGDAPVAARVDENGAVVLPRPVRGRRFRLDVLDARFPAGTPARDRDRRAVGIGELTVRGVRPSAGASRHRGTAVLPCGTAKVAAGGRTVALGGRVDVAALDAGRPLRLRACAKLALPAGEATVAGVAAPLRVDALRLASAAPAASPAPASTTGRGGRVLSAGLDGARVQVDGPSWLVYGQSYDRHWRATCDGRDLGTPRPMQGYANAWPIAAGCTTVAFTYGLQKAADAASLLALVFCLALLGLLLAIAWRARRGRVSGDAAPRTATRVEGDLAPASLDPAPPRPWPLPHALLAGVAIAAVVGGAFGLRAGVVAGPVAALILLRAISDALIARAAAVLLVVALPGAYVVYGLTHDEHHLAANATKYPLDRIAAHWLTLAGLLLVVVLLVRTLATARTRDRLPSEP